VDDVLAVHDHLMRMPLALATTVALANSTYAERLPVEDVTPVVVQLRDALAWPKDADSPPNVGSATQLVAPPFRYGGLDLAGAYSFAQAKYLEPCRKRWGLAGTVKAADLPKFLACAALLHWTDRFETATWRIVTSRQLPKLLKHHAKSIAALDGALLVLAYTPRSSAETEYWNLFAATRTADGVRLIGWFAARQEHGDD
jgi:hypothetical protein